MENKRGLSAIVATLLIVVITIAAVLIVWTVIQKQLASSSEEAASLSDSLIQSTKLKMSDVSYDELGNIYVKLENNWEEIEKASFLVSNSKGSESYAVPETIPIGVSTIKVITSINSPTSISLVVAKKIIVAKEISSDDFKQNENLVLYLPFEENSGTATFDESGNGNNGAINGATWTTGKIGNALSFDGGSNSNTVADGDYVSVLNNPTLKFGAENFSISFWTYRTADGWQAGSYIDYPSGSSDGFNTYDALFWVKTNTGELAHITLNEGKNSWEYHTFVITQSSSPYIKHYINGVLNQAGYTEVGNKGTINPSGNLIIGWSTSGGANRYFNGKIDEVRVYNKALSASEVKALYSIK